MAFRKILLRPIQLTNIHIREKSTIRQARLSGSSLHLSYTTYDPASEIKIGAPLVITHGLMGNKGNWNSLCKVLSKKGRQVISVDARNHGESPHTEEMNYHVMSKDILDLLDELAIEKAILLGHSMGGKTSMLTALKHPERVESLIVVDVSPSTSPRAKNYPSLLQNMLNIQQKLTYDHPELPLPSAKKLAEEMLKDVEQDLDVRQFLVTNLLKTNTTFRWKVNLDSIINNFRTVCEFPSIPDVCYNGPTLFIGGSESKYIVYADLPEIKRLFPNSQVHHIEGAGHWVHADKPSVFLDTVQTFLNEHEKSNNKNV